jgi:hypothetical protein
VQKYAACGSLSRQETAKDLGADSASQAPSSLESVQLAHELATVCRGWSRLPEHKSHLIKSLRTKLRVWRDPNARFIILHDQDSNDCHTLKQELVQICQDANHSDTIVRIVCRELESWYLGNLPAVEQAFGRSNLVHRYGRKARFRNPDNIANPAKELMCIVPEYRKVSGSMAIGAVFDHTNVNSKSFEASLPLENQRTTAKKSFNFRFGSRNDEEEYRGVLRRGVTRS